MNMDTRQLERIARDHLSPGVHYGICAIDELPSTLKRPLALIVNLSPSGTEGSHWIGIWISSHGYAEHFDSFGSEPLPTITAYLDRYSSDWAYNTRLVQSPISTLCGAFAVQYLEAREQNGNVDFDNLLRHLFPFGEPLKNDRLVQTRMKRHYSTDLPIIDTTLWRLPGLGGRARSAVYWTP